MKQLFVRLFNFYIQASIHVALAVVSLLYVFVVSMRQQIDNSLFLTVFFGTVTGYNFVKYASIAKLYHSSLTNALKVIQAFSLVSFVLMCFYILQLPITTLLVFGAIGLLTLLYAIPFVASKNIRSITGLKIYVVAICWAITTVLLPLVYYNLTFEKEVLVNFFQIIALVIALIIPFDIRDLEYDNKQLNTIPQQFGVKKAKGLSVLLFLCICALELIIFKGIQSYVLMLICSLSTIVILLMPLKAPKYYCSFLVESMPILYGLLILIC